MAALLSTLQAFGANLAQHPTTAATGAAAAGVGALGFTGFEYNKANWMADNALRFKRFTAVRGYMNTQVSQYRADIRGLTGAVLKKVNVILDTACLFMCTSAALSCAGRIGMHGAAPPGWLCALYSGHIFLGIMYLTTCIWLGFHALNRAQCGMVSLLTRKVRLPIPSLEQIDTARVFFSSYEKQPWRDIFRVPYFGRHPEWAPEFPNSSSDEEDQGKKTKEGKEDADVEKRNYGAGQDCSTEGFGSTRFTTVPTWIRDEQVMDKATWAVPSANDDNKKADPHDAPAHFKQYMRAQKQWFHYEVYHRISLLYGVTQFIYAICYYCIATALSELRGFWIAWSIPMVFLAAQALLLRLDIFRPRGSQVCYHLEWLGHAAPYFAVTAGTIEYRLWYSRAAVLVTWGFVLLCFFCHMMFALRFLDLAEPSSSEKEMPETDAKQWWPVGWKVPMAFANNLFIITPPKKLKKGQHDLLHEAVTLKSAHGGVKSARRRRHKEKTSSGKYSSRRATANDKEELKRQVRHIEGRIKHIHPQVVGAQDQVHLKKLRDEFEATKHQVLHIVGGSLSDSSGGSGSESYSKKTQSGYVNPDMIDEASASLNSIAENLDELEKYHQVNRVETSTSGPVDPEHDMPSTPLWIIRSVVGTHIFVWFFMLLATVAEITLGSEAILSWPGEPPWIRNQKMRPYQPGNHIHKSSDPLPDWYRLFSAATISPVSTDAHGVDVPHEDGLKPKWIHQVPGESTSHGDEAGGHSSAGHASAPAPAHAAEHGGHHRRLDEGVARQAMDDLVKVLPSLDWIATAVDEVSSGKEHQPVQWPLPTQPGLPTEMVADSSGMHPHTATSVPAEGFMAPSLKSLPVSWPAFFEPQHLACQPRATGAAIAALTSRGFGATLQLQNSSHEDAQSPISAHAFALEGVEGALAGASWTASGLHLVTKAGVLVHCPGHKPTESGTWPCKAAVGAALAVPRGSWLLAAAVAEPKLGERLVALLFDNLPTTVVLFKDEGNSHGWQAAGEVHLPPWHARSAVPGGGQVHLAFAGDSILVTTGDGAVHHRPLHKGGKQVHTVAPLSPALREWRATCMLSPETAGSLVRLALRQTSASASAPWRPELVLSPA